MLANPHPTPSRRPPPVGSGHPGGTGPALGMYANSASAEGSAEPKTAAELTERERRYKWLRHGQSLLWDRDLPDPEQHRMVYCLRTLLGESAGLWRSDKGARVSGVKTCGSVWSCPCCSPKIVEPRRKELLAAMGTHAKAQFDLADGTKGTGKCNLITVTFSHHGRLEWNDAPDSRAAERVARERQLLEGQLGKFATALSRWKGSRAYQRVLEQHGHIGSVRSLEVTVGDQNGWHPHTHEVAFVAQQLEMFRWEYFSEAAAEIRANPWESKDWPKIADHLRTDPIRFELAITPAYRELRDGWIGACLRAGLVEPKDVEAMRLRALDIRDGTYAAEYAAKWGRELDGWSVASELTKSHAKVGTRLTNWGDHYTPMQLLAFAAEGDAWAGFRFKAFSLAFAGKRMLTWSRGLRAHFGLGDEKTNEQLAAMEEPMPEERQVGEMTAEQLRDVTSRSLLGQLLRWVHEVAPGQEAIDRWIADRCAQAPPTRRGTLRKRRTFGPGYSILDT